jgi:hypothetical protein
MNTRPVCEAVNSYSPVEINGSKYSAGLPAYVPVAILFKTGLIFLGKFSGLAKFFVV